MTRTGAWYPPGCSDGIWERSWVSPWKDSRCSLTDEDLAMVADDVYRRQTFTSHHPDWKGVGSGPVDARLRDQVVAARSLDEAVRLLRDHMKARGWGASGGPDLYLRYSPRGAQVCIRHTEWGEWTRDALGWCAPECTFVEVLRAGTFSWREIAAWARAEAPSRPWVWHELPAVDTAEQPTLFEVPA